MAKQHPIVGAWTVKAENAPVPYHMFTFHADGTASQSNPNTSHKKTDDSQAMGGWRREKTGSMWKNDKGLVRARLVEVMHDRESGEITHGVLSFAVRVGESAIEGTFTFERRHPETEELIGKVIRGKISGKKVKP